MGKRSNFYYTWIKPTRNKKNKVARYWLRTRLRQKLLSLRVKAHYSWATYLFQGNIDDCHTPHTNIKVKAQVWRKPRWWIGLSWRKPFELLQPSFRVWKSKWRSRFCSKEGAGLLRSLFKHWCVLGYHSEKLNLTYVRIMAILILENWYMIWNSWTWSFEKWCQMCLPPGLSRPTYIIQSANRVWLPYVSMPNAIRFMMGK